MICGADNWVAIEEFGEAKEEWFSELLGLENGIPSHDTFGAVYGAIDTEQFSECFSRWVAGAQLANYDELFVDNLYLQSLRLQG
jgi:hypothetical protein